MQKIILYDSPNMKSSSMERMTKDLLKECFYISEKEFKDGLVEKIEPKKFMITITVQEVV